VLAFVGYIFAPGYFVSGKNPETLKHIWKLRKIGKGKIRPVNKNCYIQMAIFSSKAKSFGTHEAIYVHEGVA